MNVPLIVAIGAGACCLGALPIYLDRNVPGKATIVAASSLRGVLVALLVAFSLPSPASWAAGVGLGVLYGVLTAMVVLLSKGSGMLMHARYLLPSAVATGAAIGALVKITSA